MEISDDITSVTANVTRPKWLLTTLIFFETSDALTGKKTAKVTRPKKWLHIALIFVDVRTLNIDRYFEKLNTQATLSGLLWAK